MEETRASSFGKAGHRTIWPWFGSSYCITCLHYNPASSDGHALASRGTLHAEQRNYCMMVAFMQLLIWFSCARMTQNVTYSKDSLPDQPVAVNRLDTVRLIKLRRFRPGDKALLGEGGARGIFDLFDRAGDLGELGSLVMLRRTRSRSFCANRTET